MLSPRNGGARFVDVEFVYNIPLSGYRSERNPSKLVSSPKKIDSPLRVSHIELFGYFVFRLGKNRNRR